MHQTIIKTLDKKNNLDEMIDKRNLMINAELNDNLRRDLNVHILNTDRLYRLQLEWVC